MVARDAVREIAQGCIAVRVRLLNRLVSGICDAGLREHGVNVAQVNILVAVGHSGPLTPSEVAATLVMDKSTLSRDVEALLANDWLRKIAGNDKRSHKLELTAAGREKVASILPVWREAQTELRKRLGAKNLTGLFAAAERIWAEQSADE
ncbi:MAG: MarR family winged helix-turn-helix transcriptional regulator [Planctomycetia bacterium]|nr:MarR family winged helix-turn-helix transcriptional regulator [Planctomycetia bacterium]